MSDRHNRSLLGPADITDVHLTRLVADSLGEPQAQLLSSTAEIAAYDLESLTTAGRYWVRGLALVDAMEVPFAIFVKVVQSWNRSALFEMVPPQLRAFALETLPWQCEPAVYRSDLGDRLPQGLRMPRALAVIDLDDESAAIWIEAIDVADAVWDVPRLADAAYLLGRLAATPGIRPLARLGDPGRRRGVRSYVEGRVAHMLAPALRADEIWRHPLVAPAFDAELRDALRAVTERLPEILEEIEAMPVLTAHGDACTRNLLIPAEGTGLVLIDYAFWTEAPVGFDLTQLMLGEIQVGERPAEALPALEAGCLPAYVRGLAAEGLELPLALVRRSHALSMLVFSGLSAVPLEHLDKELTPELHRLAGQRAASARFMLDLVAATEPSSGRAARSAAQPAQA